MRGFELTFSTFSDTEVWCSHMYSEQKMLAFFAPAQATSTAARNSG
jgi:hypothetical protein